MSIETNPEAEHDDVADYDDTPSTPHERLADIRARVMTAQDAVGWANQTDSQAFNDALARSVVEYGRCLRDLASLVEAHLPEENR